MREVNVITSVRNIVVLDNGTTDALKQEIRNLLGKRNEINIEGPEVVIEWSFVQQAHKAVSDVAATLEDRLKTVLERALRPKSVWYSWTAYLLSKPIDILLQAASLSICGEQMGEQFGCQKLERYTV